MSDDQVCGHEKDSGDLCEVSFGLCDCHGQCWSHSPCREGERQEARSKGGHSTARKRKQEDAVLPADSPAAPTSVEEAARMLSWLSGAVLRGEVDRHTARDACYVLRAFVDAAEVDVEERLEDVEADQEAMREQLQAMKRRGDMRSA